jgi:hypothetical protein
MSSHQLTPQAVEDLLEIWTYIAGDDVEAANRVEATIYDACALLADTPLAAAFEKTSLICRCDSGSCNPTAIIGLSTTRRKNRCRSFGLFTPREIFRAR